jgi:hypothetical protein
VEGGFVIRELPDGGSEFVLEDPSLSCIRIDHVSTLQFGPTDLVIRAPFSLTIGGTIHQLDPRHRDGLGPLLALFPATVHWLWTTVRGELTAAFRGGPTVTVTPDPIARAWAVGNVYCLPSGPI